MLESETIAMNFLSFVTLKSISLSCISVDLAYHDFVTRFGQMENTSSLSYADLPDSDTFHLSISTNHTHHYHQQSH